MEGVSVSVDEGSFSSPFPVLSGLVGVALMVLWMSSISSGLTIPSPLRSYSANSGGKGSA